MFLKTVCGVVAGSLLAVAASAQQPTAKPQFLQQPDKTVTYASAADVADLIARAKKEHKDNGALVVGKILQLAPYTAFLEYRENTRPLADVGLHPKDDELVYIIEGSGTLVTGGTIAADRMKIEGGTSQTISKGDFILIPANTPHWISHIDRTIVQMSLHIPRPPAQ